MAYIGLLLIAAEEEDRLHQLRIHRRHLRDNCDPFDVPENRFKELYRLSRDIASYVLQEIDEYAYKGIRTTYIPLNIRLCVALHFFATGGNLRDIGQSFMEASSKTSVWRMINEISTILETNLLSKWIQFPKTNQALANIKERFFTNTEFPGVIGAIDCTHVSIAQPKLNEHCYFNRKGYHSKNVQLVCDFDLNILNVFARYGGATHDAFIWDASQLNASLEQMYSRDNNINQWLIGDSGYPLQPWLLVPYKKTNGIPLTDSEIAFNKGHAQARNCVERLNGVLKGRFQCLSKKVMLDVDPRKAGRIINACCVLHNILQFHKFGEEDFDDDEDVQCDNEEENYNNNSRLLTAATIIRNRMRQQYFL